MLLVFVSSSHSFLFELPRCSNSHELLFLLRGGLEMLPSTPPLSPIYYEGSRLSICF